MSEYDGDQPAFPALDSTEAGLSLRYCGMTLRDYFAAKALQGILAQSMGTAGGATVQDIEWITNYSYGLADAMLEARKK